MKSRAQRYRYVRHVVSGTRPSPWSPLSLGSSLAAWYKADAGCFTDAACLFASASSQYLSKTSPTFAPTTKMTIAFDFKPTSTVTQSLVERWSASNNNNQFGVKMAADQLYVSIASALSDSGSNYYVSDGTLPPASNYRIVIVYDGTLAAASRLAVYVNGAAFAGTIVGTIPATLTTSTQALIMGEGQGYGQNADGAMARLGFSSLALSGAALTAAHTSTFWADMTAARQADWFSFYNLCEVSSTRVDSTGLNNLTPTNGPTVAAGPGEGLAVNNSPVKRWESQYGSNHAVQATVAYWPTFTAAQQNGKPCVIFGGSGQFLNPSSIDNAAAAIGVVANCPSPSGYQVLVSTAKHIAYANLGVANKWGGYNGADVSSGVALSSTYKSVIENTRSANDVDLVTNGTKVNVATGVAFDARNTEIGASSGAQPHVGGIAEIVITNRALTDSECASLAAYFASASRWSL